jgi:transposase InsO family protein
VRWPWPATAQQGSQSGGARRRCEMIGGRRSVRRDVGDGLRARPVGYGTEDPRVDDRGHLHALCTGDPGTVWLPSGQRHRVLERVGREHEFSQAMRVDQGIEFMSRNLDLWAYQRGVTLDFSRTGRPTDNALIESLNEKLRAKCLNAHWFISLDDARPSAWAIVATTTRFARIAGSATNRRRPN